MKIIQKTPINAMLNLKLGLREKEAYKISETWSILVQCSSKCALGFLRN